MNRLGVPVPTKRIAKSVNHHSKNLEHLKKVFRTKNTIMPYKHEELR